MDTPSCAQVSRALRTLVQRESVVRNFDKNPDAWERVRPHITGEASISHRMLDHLVTNGFPCEAYDVRNGVWRHYQAEQETLVKRLQKKRIDPFGRDHSGTGKFIYRGVATTEAQLTFFWWAHRHGLLDYVCSHADEIRTDMRLLSQHSSGVNGDSLSSSSSSSSSPQRPLPPVPHAQIAQNTFSPMMTLVTPGAAARKLGAAAMSGEYTEVERQTMMETLEHNLKSSAPPKQRRRVRPRRPTARSVVADEVTAASVYVSK